MFDLLAVSYALRLVLWSLATADATGYRGSWLLGVHGSGLRGLASHHHVNGWGGREQADDAPDYREVTVASHEELAQRPGHVAERLIGRLTRAWARTRATTACSGRSRRADVVSL